MKITAFFSLDGTPATGLTPDIDIWKIDGTQVITSQSMTEVDGGFYYYDFTTYDEDEEYCIRADGGVTLTGSDRYLYSTNETADVNTILKVEKGNWEIKGNQMVFYDSDGSTELYKFNLRNKSGVPTETDVYKREVV